MRFLIRQGQLGTTKKLLSLRSIGAKGRLSLIHMDRIINIAMGLWHVGLLIPTGAYCAGFILSFKREPRALRHIAWLAKELLVGESVWAALASWNDMVLRQILSRAAVDARGDCLSEVHLLPRLFVSFARYLPLLVAQ